MNAEEQREAELWARLNEARALVREIHAKWVAALAELDPATDANEPNMRATGRAGADAPDHQR
jgi:hypothetical protein